MKKTTRTARKVLSVFLSVLMILTTLTVAAPGLALAADTYYVRVYLNIYDGANSDGYGNPYTVVTDPSSEFYGKPDDYKWDYGSSWSATDNSKGYDGEVNMAGFTLFYDNDKKYETYDLAADLVAATTTLGNNWTSMDDLTLENFADCQNKVEKVYTFALDSIPSSLFWINDENNAVNGETSFGFHKITVAESSTGAEHILWTGLSGSESYYECYYGTITPTGLITPWDDCPDAQTYTFYKDYTTSAVGTWIDPYNAGDYNVYPVNNYLSGGVSAAFTVGNSGSQTNIDFVDVGNTNNYYINFTNHSTQDATITLFKAENKALLNGYYDNYPIPSGKTVSFALNKASMGGDGTYTDFSFKFKLDNVYNSDGATQSDFYQAAGIGSWNTTDDLKAIGLPAGESSNEGFTIKGSRIDVQNRFMVDAGILEETKTLEGNRTTNVNFEYTYWVDSSNISTWQDAGLRMYAEKWSYYRLHLQPSGTSGTINITGDMANTGNVSISMADLLMTYNKSDINVPSTADRPWAYYNSPCTPYWQGVEEQKWGTLWDDSTPAYFPFCGNIIKGSTTSSNPGKIVFTNMTWRSPSSYDGFFSGTINVYSFDKTDLRNYVYGLGGLGANWAPMRNRFSDAQWNAYEIALKDAKEVLANQKTNQKAVTDAYNALVSACEALKDTDNLVNQVAEVTYTQRESDYASAAVATTEKYILMPVGSETAVPGHDAYKHTTTGTVVGKQSSNLKTNYTTADTDIDHIDYRYWKIDFAGVDEALTKATEILNAASETYSDEYYEKILDARNSVSYFDRDADTWTPTHQSDVSDPLANLNALLAHAEDTHDNCVFDGDDEDTEADIVITTANCLETGYVKHVCIVCGKAKVVGETEANGSHTVETWTKVDENNHSGTCTVCGETVTAAHTFASSVLTRPTFVDGAWTDGYYTRTCVCGETKTETAVRADYSELDDAVAALEELKNNENLTDEEKAVITDALADADNLAENLVTAEQGDIDALVKELKDIKADADEAINNKELGINNITEATSGVKVQFIDASGLGTIDSVQLGEDEGFIIRVTNGNADSNITVTGVSDVAAEAKTLEPGKSADYRVEMPDAAGIYEYAITYTIDGLKNADGTAVTATTKAYLYVKDEAYQPKHGFLEEVAPTAGDQKSGWDFFLDSVYYGDFALVHDNKAPKDAFGNNNLVQDSTGLFDYIKEEYDFEDEQCYAGCTGTGSTPYVKGDAHAATYRYYIDTSLAPTYEAAGLRARIVETAISKYNDAPFKSIRLANNQAYLDSIQGDDKTFSVTLIPGETSNVPDMRWTATSTGTIDVSQYNNPDQNDLIFGRYDALETYSTAYENFAGAIPTNTEDAKLMLSTRMEFNGQNHLTQAEAVTMTTHLYITSYDKAALREAVANAETAGYNSAYFDAEKYEAYENALKTAKEVLGKAETNQNEVDEATAALNTAIDNLAADEAEAKFVLTVTHSIHNGKDRNSENPDTSNKDYYLLATSESVNAPLLGDTVLATYNVNKHDDAATFEIENNEDTNKGYHYWYIDYSGVQDAIDAADAIINDTENGYSEEYKQQAQTAKDALEAIKNGESTTTAPESQGTVKDAIDAVTALTGHTCDEAVEIPAEAPTCEEAGLTAGAKCSVCGKITKAQEVDPAINHNYDIANAQLITRPELVDGQWTTGKYEATCLNDESHKKELTGVKRADYTAFDAAVAELKELATYENFTDEVKAEILNYATQLENGTFDPDGDGTPNVPLNYVDDYTYNGVTIPGEQATLNSIVAELDAFVADIESNKTDERFIKPDYTEIIAEWEEYLALVEQYGGEVEYATEGDSLTATVTDDGYIKDATAAFVNDGFVDIMEIMNDPAANKAENQLFINGAKDQIAAINEGIIDGTLRDPNFEAYDAEVETYNEETSKVNVSAEDVAAVEAAMAVVDAIEADPDATAADSDTTIATQTAIIKAINEKYAPCAAGNHTYADATCTEAKTCTVCGATDGDANGHTWKTEPDSYTLPVYDEETATWSQGEFIYGCEYCTETVTIYADRADYSEYDALVKAYDDIVNDESIWSTLTDETIEALSEYKGKLDSIAQDYTKATTDDETGITTPDGEKELDALLEGLDVEIETIKSSIEDGSGRMLDFSEFEEAVSEYEGDPDDGIDATIDIATPEDIAKATDIINTIRDLANLDPVPNAASEEQKQIDEATEEIRTIINKYADCLADGHTWGAWAENVTVDADGNFETATYSRTCEKCGATEAYEVERENYDAYDNAVEKAEALLENKDLTDAAKEAIQNALDEANALDQNLPADIVYTDEEGKEVVIDVNENAEAIEETTSTLNGVIDSLYEDGELKDEYKKVDYSKYEAAVNAYENLKDTMTEADKVAVEEIKTEINAIPKDGTAAQYQTQVDKAAEDIAKINAKYGDCATGNHTWGEPVLTKNPTADAKGEYTETCTVCGATQITEVDLADYDEFNNAVEKLENLLNTENLTDEAKQAIENALADAEALDKNLPKDVTTADGKFIEGGQDEIDALVTELNGVVADVTADITDGSALKPDYEAWEEAETAYDALDKTNVKDEIITEADGLKADIAAKQADDTLTQATATQKDIDNATARLNQIVAGIKDGSLRDPDYSAVEDKITDAKDNDNLNKDTQDKIKEIEEALEEIKTKTEPEANAKDDQDEVTALEEQLDEILKDIADGKATAPDYTAWDEAETAYDALDKTNVPTELVTEATNLKATIDTLKADDTANAVEDQPTIDDATTRLNEIITEINGILTEEPDFDDYDASHDAYEELVNQYGDKIKDSVADDVAALDTIVDGVRNDETATKVDDQDTIDDAKTQLDAIIEGIKDGSLIKDADFTNVKEDLEAAKELASNNDVIDDVNKSITNIENAINTLEQSPATNATSQDVIDILEKQLEEIIKGIEDGTLVKPDLTDAEADLADAKDKAEKNDVIDGVDTAIENLENALDAIEHDGTATKADDQDDVEAIEKALEEIIAGINDGSLVKPDYTDAEQAITNAENTDSMTDADKEALEDLKKELEDLKKDPTTNKKDDQDDVDGIKDAVQTIVDKYADCENGNHNWGTPELTTAPTADAQGEYTETCGTCGATQITKVDLADYDAFDDAVDALEDLLDTENLTDEAKKAIEDALADAKELDKNLPADVTTVDGKEIKGGQDEIDDLVAELEKVVADTNTGIADGSLIKPDYTEVDKDLADAKDKAENNDVIDGVKDNIKDIEDALNNLKDDPETNKGEHQDDVDALEKELEDIIAGIEDGSLVKPDYTEAENAVKEAEKDLNGGKLSDEDQKALDDLKDKLEDLKNDPTTNKKNNQDDVNGIKDAAQVIVNKYSECAKGNHAYETKTVIPTCTEKGYDLHTCKVCGKTYKDNYVDETGHIERVLDAVEPTCSSVGLTEGKKCEKCGTITVAQEEIPMLRHTDADGDGVCDVCGKGGLYDGCTCLCHNNHWFWRLVYLIIRIIWRVFRIHQICPCGAVHF